MHSWRCVLISFFEPSHEHLRHWNEVRWNKTRDNAADSWLHSVNLPVTQDRQMTEPFVQTGSWRAFPQMEQLRMDKHFRLNIVIKSAASGVFWCLIRSNPTKFVRHIGHRLESLKWHWKHSRQKIWPHDVVIGSLSPCKQIAQSNSGKSETSFRNIIVDSAKISYMHFFLHFVLKEKNNTWD